MQEFLSKEVEIIIDRPKGSAHPKFGWIYPINYGYLPETKAGDNEPIDAYVVGVNEACKRYKGVVIAIVKRFDDNEDKLIVAPKGMHFTKEQLEKFVYFQERFFNSQIYMY